MYLNSGLEGEEAIYTASEDGFYKLRGYSIYYERNQMMQDYMVSRKDARRVESGTRDMVIQDFRDRMEERKQSVGHARSAIGLLGGTCSVLAVLVLAGGLVMFGNYRKMKDMEAVIASVMPSDVKTGGLRSFAGQDEDGESGSGVCAGGRFIRLWRTIVIDQGTGNDVNASGNDAAGMEAGADVAGNTNAGTSASGAQNASETSTPHGRKCRRFGRMRLQRRPWYRSRLML